MSSNFVRCGIACGLAIFVASAIAWSQDHQDTRPAARDGVAVFNVVEGRSVVTSCLPEGTRVEKGDLVCELDPAPLQDRLATQEIIVRGAEADVHATRIAREVAVMAVNEYKEAAFHHDLAETQGEIKRAEALLSRAEDQIAWAQRMFEKGYISMAEKVSNELALKGARFALEEAQSKKLVLIDFTRARSLKSLTGAVEAARASELAKQAVLERERSAQRRLTQEIGRCKVQAPARGRIAFTAPRGAGAVVHDGEILFKVVAVDPASNSVK